MLLPLQAPASASMPPTVTEIEARAPLPLLLPLQAPASASMPPTATEIDCHAIAIDRLELVEAAPSRTSAVSLDGPHDYEGEGAKVNILASEVLVHQDRFGVDAGPAAAIAAAAQAPGRRCVLEGESATANVLASDAPLQQAGFAMSMLNPLFGGIRGPLGQELYNSRSVRTSNDSMGGGDYSDGDGDETPPRVSEEVLAALLRGTASPPGQRVPPQTRQSSDVDADFWDEDEEILESEVL